MSRPGSRSLGWRNTRRRSNSNAVDAEILFELTADGLKEGARPTTRDRERWE
jgi:hypothetical protein